MIAEWHCTDKEDGDKEGGDHVYGFNKEGMEVYRSFANEMVQIMNEQWESGIMNQGNVSKDKRSMIR